ncbi:MAG TPA: rhomboid family intramembrane serine protease [Sedimentisphaerales bacterium]|nr:rhomboid family intramembrane serine protease [Sedimentisphaerales bacterium]
MGLYDRDYTQENWRTQSQYRPQVRLGLPQMTPMVKKLLIINIMVSAVSFLIVPVGNFIVYWFSVFPATVWMSLQPWRPITYQFLHAGVWHIFWNMLILVMFGPMLERLWGSRKFLTFYLVCGAMGGLFYPLLVLTGWLEAAPLVGASGSILGMLAAGAILFPQMRVYIWGILPIKLMFLALILAGISILTLLRPDQLSNAGGEAAHLAGMAAGAAYVFSENWRSRLRVKFASGRSEKKVARHRALELELDRILQKVHDTGIHSLSRQEKRILKKATEAERIRNKV